MWRKSHLPAWGFTVVGSIAVALVLEQRLDIVGVPVFLAAGGALVLLVGWLAPAHPQPTGGPQPLSGVGTVLSFASAVFFRLRYLWVVPAGYGFEPLNFVFFSRRLFDEGFPYIPYAWYAHTLYSYFIAAGLLLVDNDLEALRYVSVTISLLTVLALQVCARWLFGSQVAWLAVGLLAPSWWHLFASRNAYHQFLMPLFQLLFVVGAVAGLRDRRRWGFYLAGAALVGSLHAYWGLYLLLPYSGLLALQVLLWDRRALLDRGRHIIAAVILTLLGLVPLGKFFWHDQDLFAYPTRAFSPQASDAADLLTKLGNNGWYVLWALSGHPKAQAPYGSVVDPLVAAAALVGLALSFRWCKVSFAHGAVGLLFVVNVAGLLFTQANYFYITSTMAAMYLLAALALGEGLSAAQRWRPRWGAVFALGMMLLLGWRSLAGYQEFFHRRVLTDLQSPSRPIGRAYQVMEKTAALLPSSSVFIARDDPGRFAEEIYDLGRRLPSQSFMLGVQPLDAVSVLFPAQRLTAQRKVELIFPNEKFVERRLLPILRQLYPNLRVTPELPPEPYRGLDATPIVLRISLPWEDVERRFGLTDGARNGRAQGFFVAPVDGAYRFRRTRLGPPAMQIAGRPLADGETVFLERGLHRVEVVDWFADSGGVQYQIADGSWVPIDDMLVNAAGVADKAIDPYVARPGRLADFFFDYKTRLQTGYKIRDAPISQSGAVAAILIDGVKVMDASGQTRWEVGLPGPLDYRGVFDAERLLALRPGAGAVAVSPAAVETAVPDFCGLIDVTPRGPQLLGLCEHLGVAFLGTKVAPVQLIGPDGAALLRPVALRVRGDSAIVLDAAAGDVLFYDNDWQLAGRQVMPHLWGDSELAVDGANNLYLRRWRFGWRTYAADGALLFHPLTRQPLLFSREGFSLENAGLRRLHIAAGYATLVSTDGYIDVYERHAVADSAPAVVESR